MILRQWSRSKESLSGRKQVWAMATRPVSGMVALRHHITEPTSTAKPSPKYRLAIELRPANGSFVWGWPECLGNLKNYDKAISAIEELIEQNKELVGPDDDFSEMYWTRLLPDIAGWKSELNDYPAAERIYKQCVDHWMEQTDLLKPAQDAIFGMLTVLNKQERYIDAVAVLDQCSGRVDSDEKPWIRTLFHGYSVTDGFHNHLIVAAKRSGKVWTSSWSGTSKRSTPRPRMIWGWPGTCVCATISPLCCGV